MGNGFWRGRLGKLTGNIREEITPPHKNPIGLVRWALFDPETTPGSSNIAVAGKWTWIEDVYISY